MALRHNLHKKTKPAFFPALLVFIFFAVTPAFALSSPEEIAANLRKPPQPTDKPIYRVKGSFAEPVVYIIGQDDILNISVWQNLGIPDEGKEGSKEAEYTVNNGDVLGISVWQWPDLDKEVIVRPDGRISFPLVGDIQAKGRTLTELDDTITKKLSEFIKSPEVSVMIKQLALTGGTTRKGEMSYIKVDDLSFDGVRVRPDGKISFPLIGDIQAEGLTLDEFRNSINSKIAKYVNNSDVFVQVTEFGGNKIIILGQVTDPGVYRTGPLTILEALSLAGGYTNDAILRNVLVLRGDLNNPQVIKVNLSKAITGRDYSQNIPIEARDIIYVPKSFIADINYVLTELLQPLTSSSSAVTSIKTIRTRVTPKK